MLRADRFFLLAAFVFGSLFVFATPPFQVPDEPAHFYRAYGLSEGNATATRRAGRSGETLPVSLSALVDLFSDLPGHPDRKVEPLVFSQAYRITLDPEDRDFLDFANTAAYTAVPYLSQAAGIALGRVASVPPLGLLYLARLANLLVATALIYISLRQLPAYRWLATLIALTPMALFQRASVSADATTMAAAFLLAATVARLAFGPGAVVGRRDVAVMALAAAVLNLSKPVYLPLALTPLLIPASRFPHGWRTPALLAHIAISAASAALAIANALSVRISSPIPGVDPEKQIVSALGEPFRFLELAVRDYLSHVPAYAAEFIGRLGWLDTPLPTLLLTLHLAVLAALLILDTSRSVVVKPQQRSILASLVAATLLLLSAVLYAIWTPRGASFIDGIQGRYFLPVAPVAIWIGHTRRWVGAVAPVSHSRVAALFCAFSLAVSLTVMIWRYYV